MTEEAFSIYRLAEFVAKGGHSLFAPSSAERWIECAGSLIPNAINGDVAGFEAAYGTRAHELAAGFFTIGVEPYSSKGTTSVVNGYEVVVDDEMVEMVHSYIDYCREQEFSRTWVEQRVNTSYLMPVPDQGGTLDFGTYHNRCVTITDLKSGWVFVDVIKNWQLIIYGLGLIREIQDTYEIDRVRFRIYQPRLSNFGVWEISLEELLKYEPYIQERAALAAVVGAPRTPGEKQCRYCSERPHCPALVGLMDLIVDASFDDISIQAGAVEQGRVHPSELASFNGPEDWTFGRLALERLRDQLKILFYKEVPEAQKLSTPMLDWILYHRALFQGWFAVVDQELEDRIREGGHSAHFHIVNGNASREWIDDGAPARELAWIGIDPAKAYIRKPISPAQAEEIIKKAGFRKADAKRFIKSSVVRRPGKPTLAPRTVDRESVIDLAGSSFDDISED